MREKDLIFICKNNWIYKNCYIQKTLHPKIKPYHIFINDDKEITIDTTFTFKGAKQAYIKYNLEKL